MTATTISAGAAAGLMVALMVVATDSRAAEIIAVKPGASYVHPGEAKGFNPQPDPPREISGFDPQPEPPKAVLGDGSVKPVTTR